MKNHLLISISFLITQYTCPKILEFPQKNIAKEIPSNPSQRLSNAPYLSGDTFRSFGDFVIDKTNRFIDPENIKDGNIIFIAAHKEFLDFFFQNVHPKINAYYILITHNTDMSEFSQYLKYLDDNNIIAWLGSNLTLEHKKTFPIPIGLANKFWRHFRGFNGNTRIIDEAIKNAPKKRDTLFYMNFNPNTNNKERETVLKTFSSKKFCYNAKRKPYLCFINDLARSKFVASPPGNGIDCHRTWEALHLGAIPIVSSTKLNKMYKNLPVMIIDDWNTITEEFLNKKYKEIKGKNYKMQKLTANYWLKKISKLKEKAIFKKNFVHKKKFSKNPKIPKIIHQVCLGHNGIMPDKYKKFQKSWNDKYPDWKYKFWSEKEVVEFGLENKKSYDQTNNYAVKSNIAIYEILYRLGGLYVNPNFECLKNFNMFHHYCGFYAGVCLKNMESIIGFMGSCPKNPIIKKWVQNIKQQKNKKEFSMETINRTELLPLTNCFFVTTNEYNDNTVIFPTTYFYPVLN